MGVKSAIPHPRIMGVIRECGGKMHMRESKLMLWTMSSLLTNDSCFFAEEWDNAQTDFFESFKNYDEAGSPQRIQVLK